ANSPIEDLFQDLAPPTLAVRISASNAMVERGGEDAVKLLRTAISPESPPRRRVHAMWILHRLGRLDQAVLLALAHEKTERELRVHSLKVLLERPTLEPPL